MTNLIYRDALIEYINNIKGGTITANDVARFPGAAFVHKAEYDDLLRLSNLQADRIAKLEAYIRSIDPGRWE